MDSNEIVTHLLKENGLFQVHFDWYHQFLEELKTIVQNTEIRSRVDPQIYLRYKALRVGKASLIYGGKKEIHTPTVCRGRGITYAAPLDVDVEYIDSSRNLVKRNNISLGRIPVMLKSLPCRLYNMDGEELTRLGECELDPGGYFIIRGIEKFVLIHDICCKNRVFIGQDEKGRVQASIVSQNRMIESTTIVAMENDKIYVKLNQFATKVPIMVVMKAMGMESDQEVMQMLCSNARYRDLLLPSIEECANYHIHTQEQALKFLREKVKRPYGGSSVRKEDVMAVLRNVFLANVPVYHNNFHKKCLYVGVMLRRMMEALIDKDKLDDENYIGNRRLELPGQLLSLLFEDLFKSMNEDANKRYDAVIKRKGACNRSFNICKCILPSRISDGLDWAFLSGNWNSKRFRLHRIGMTQNVSRGSFVQTLSLMRSVLHEPRNLQSRALHPSQWGMFCPIETPQGESCGLVRHLALTTYVTTPQDEDPIISLCNTLGVEDLELLPGVDLFQPDSYLVMLNGQILGKHRRPQMFATNMRKLRRAGKIDKFISIFVNEKEGCVYIASDGGRVCRPLLISNEEGKSRLKMLDIEQLKDGFCTLSDFIRKGLIEYIDVQEENNALIALCEAKATKSTTHIEIDAFTILGVCGGLIPFVNHNDYICNVTQCASAKQAMGNIAYNQLYRTDSLMNLLVYPQRPLLTTQTSILVGYDKLGVGQNGIVAVMSFSGYDLENAIVLNKSSLDLGFGRCAVMKRLSPGFGMSDKLRKPQLPEMDASAMQGLDEDGVICPGETLKEYDIYISRQDDKTGTDRVQKYKREEENAIVDRVVITEEDVKVMLRHPRRPEVGDKFSTRHGQKGVCSIIIPKEDFPFSERGICPDLILNPHGSRNIGVLRELLASKAGVSRGKIRADSDDILTNTCEELVKLGFSYTGKDLLYSGSLGTPLEAYIFMGPIYYQKSKHMVIDKMHTRRRGPKNILTREPVRKNAKGAIGIRVGEMERDCLIAYGASMLTYERLMLSADPFEARVCSKCGLLGYYSYKLGTEMCSLCKTGENILTLKIPYSFKLLLQELHSMNIVPRLQIKKDFN